jgi:ribosomal protein RSM22 (predicted rRNA methylase)
VAAALPIRPEVITRVADVRDLPEDAHDLVLAGSLLNELPTPRRITLVRALLRRLSTEGALVIIEPALRETARALHELRDAVLAEGGAHVFAPCTRTGPCPALDDPRDWCHEDRPFQPPPRLAELSRRTGLRMHGLKFAYLTLRRDAAPLVDAPGMRALRVVSDALDQKGTLERIVCGEEGRQRLRVLARVRDDTARSLSRAARGDVLLRAADGATTRTSPASR